MRDIVTPAFPGQLAGAFSFARDIPPRYRDVSIRDIKRHFQAAAATILSFPAFEHHYASYIGPMGLTKLAYI